MPSIILELKHIYPLFAGLKKRRRRHPKYLKRGKPNLVVIPKGRNIRGPMTSWFIFSLPLKFSSCSFFPFPLFPPAFRHLMIVRSCSKNIPALFVLPCLYFQYILNFNPAPLLLLFSVSLLLFDIPIADDILGTVLSLYMQDTSQSLPSSEEVLICSSDTTAEEVSIFDLQMNRNNSWCCLVPFTDSLYVRPFFRKRSYLTLGKETCHSMRTFQL